MRRPLDPVDVCLPTVAGFAAATSIEKKNEEGRFYFSVIFFYFSV
jgi:hypothetical protein